MEERMIAYNHYIKFIPELKNDKKIKGTYSNIITVKESLSISLPKKFNFELRYINNQGRDLKFYSNREFARTQKGQLWAFEVKEVVTFFWESGTLTLQYLPDKNFTPELLEYWCLHIVLPMFFTIEETYTFLHAGAVEVESKPILFIAESFGGKSTMTDFFIKQGHTLISDDKVATFEEDSQFIAISSHPHHRPYRKMEDLGFFIENFSTKLKAIHAIYELERVDKDNAVLIAQVQGIEKFKLLRYASEINLSFQKQKRFEYLMKMTKKVPVFKVNVPWDMNRLDEVYQAIVEHIHNIK